MRTIFVKNVGYVYCSKQVGWAEAMPAGAKWLGVGTYEGKVCDVYTHPTGNFTLKG